MVQSTVEQLTAQIEEKKSQLRQAKQKDSFNGLIEAVQSKNVERIKQACYVFLAHNRNPRTKDKTPRQTASPNQS